MSPSTNLGATLRTLSGGGTNITKSTSFNIVVKSALPTDKSFSELTDSELLQIVQALDNNLITTADLNWKVGDSRNVSLSSFKTYSSSTSSTSTQAAQTAQLVIQNIGGKTFSSGETCHYVVGFKDNVCKSYWDSDGDYSNSLIQTVENNVYNALPVDVKTCFKKFNVITGETFNMGAVTTQQYFTSPAVKEIFGTVGESIPAEANTLSQLDYYKTASNRIHSKNAPMWWTRSPYNDFNTEYSAAINSSGSSVFDCFYTGIDGVSPYGCI